MDPNPSVKPEPLPRLLGVICNLTTTGLKELCNAWREADFIARLKGIIVSKIFLV